MIHSVANFPLAVSLWNNSPASKTKWQHNHLMSVQSKKKKHQILRLQKNLLWPHAPFSGYFWVRAGTRWPLFSVDISFPRLMSTVLLCWSCLLAAISFSCSTLCCPKRDLCGASTVGTSPYWFPSPGILPTLYTCVLSTPWPLSE